MRSNRVRGALLGLALLACGSAHAQLFRAYLASDGLDSNPCTLLAPCRLLPAALAAVADGGEIWLLDSANYNTGTVSITQSVSIVAMPGALGSFVVLGGGPALSITTPGIKVALRGVSLGPLAGFAAGTVGVYINGASSLIVDRCLFAGIPQGGLQVENGAKVQVADSVFRNIGDFAMRVESGSRAAVSSTKILDSVHGLFVYSANPASLTQLTVTDALISGVSAGVVANAGNASAGVRATVTRSTIQRASWAISPEASAGTATISVSGSTIAYSNNGWYIPTAGAVVESYGNNQWIGNAGNLGSLTSVASQ